ncbi:ABC transporter ATP-binding protein [Aquipuribacter nitratireducens]|uniref:ABC transporter ATP-binding protein n=1 Tax=Aquipuribacter nitratireducens TaxID=650104 RepID=A0ABW0GKP2_9MICO
MSTHRTTGTTPAIRTRALTKTYGTHRGLSGLDLDVERGEVLGFIGPNGAGKSTTIRLLLDLLRPTSGTVEVLGQDPRTGGAGLRRRIGYLAGDLVLPERMTGARVVDLLTTLSGARGDATVRRRVLDLAERLDLDLSRPSRTLSKGNRQKIGIVQAFVHDPELLVLDEPTSGLDPLVQQTFHALVREAAARGATVFMSSHIISEVEQTADRVAVLREGRLIALATVPELRARSSRHVEVEVDAGAGVGPDALAADLALQGAAVRPAVHGGTRVAGEFPGEPADLVARLAAAPWRESLRDLVAEAPDLEAAVLRFYAPSSAADRQPGEQVPA